MNDGWPDAWRVERGAEKRRPAIVAAKRVKGRGDRNLGDRAADWPTESNKWNH
jgi:hypothetical protein